MTQPRGVQPDHLRTKLAGQQDLAALGPLVDGELGHPEPGQAGNLLWISPDPAQADGLQIEVPRVASLALADAHQRGVGRRLGLQAFLQVGVARQNPRPRVVGGGPSLGGR